MQWGQQCQVVRSGTHASTTSTTHAATNTASAVVKVKESVATQWQGRSASWSGNYLHRIFGARYWNAMLG